MHDYFRGNPDGKQPARVPARARADPGPSTATATRGSRVMDEHGLEEVWLFPTLGMLYEELLKRRRRGASPSRSPRSTAGSTRTGAATTRTASSPRRTSRSADLDWAVARARVGARPRRAHGRACARPRRTTAHGQLRPSAPDVRPVLGARQRGRHHRRRARGRQRLLEQRLRGRRLRGRVQRRRVGADRSRRFHIERAAYDFLITLVFDKLFERFPNVRIASVENGSEFLADLFKKLRVDRAQDARATSTEDPVETFRRNVWINPFWEDDVYEIVELMGADRVIFGSDWPHIEGMPAAARLRRRAQGVRRRRPSGRSCATTPSS